MAELPRCWNCGYDRSGLKPDSPCPECGTDRPPPPDVPFTYLEMPAPENPWITVAIGWAVLIVVGLFLCCLSGLMMDSYANGY